MSDEERLIAEADGEIWLTVKELARLKRVHEQTVRRWIKDGLIEAERTAGTRGHWRVRRDMRHCSHLHPSAHVA